MRWCGTNSTLMSTNSTSYVVEPCKIEFVEETSNVVAFEFVLIGVCILVLAWAIISSRTIEIRRRYFTDVQRNREHRSGLDRASVEKIPLLMFKDVSHHSYEESLIEKTRELEISPGEKDPRIVRRRNSGGLLITHPNDVAVHPALSSGPVKSETGNAKTAEDSISSSSHHHDDGEERKKTNQREETLCSICLDPFDPSDMVRKLPCKHLFHGPCVDSWFERGVFCPLCKQCPVDNTKPPPKEEPISEV